MFDAIRAAWTRIGQDGDVWLIGDLEFLQHRASIVTTVPNGYEKEANLRIFLDRCQPAAAFEFGLTIGTPRRPEVNDAQVRRLDCFRHLLLRWRSGKKARRSHTEECERESSDQFFHEAQWLIHYAEKSGRLKVLHTQRAPGMPTRHYRLTRP